MSTPANPAHAPTHAPSTIGSARRGAPGAEYMPEQPGDSIGGYRLLQMIGEGGFGVVWLAEQREPMVRRVALKVIKPGMDTRAIVARFEQERQALAVMDHPNVAKVFDAGATKEGRPYFVMEYVKGEAITDFCDRMRLSVRDRLALYIPVCEAVQHAHMKGVIHRDIKPSNILVSVPDVGSGGGPVPKVIDFGVAKAINRTLTDKTLFTEFGQIVGTPEYMSPEQADPGVIDIDTRTDVYALGAVLYELLTGALPFDAASLRSAGYAEIQRIIREVDPPRPSTRLSGLGEQRTGIADRRHTRAEDLERELRRELEWIVLKAMRKNRDERYRTPTDLAADIRNYLNGRPLEAGPESAAYRARKFVRKHRGAVLTGGLIAATLVVATAVSVWFGVREAAARREAEGARRDAETQRDIAETIEQFLNTDLLGNEVGELARTPLPELFSSAAESIAGRFGSKPALEARVRRVLGKGFIALGDPGKAEEQLKRVLELGREAGVSDDDLFDTSTSLGEALYRQERNAEAKRVLDAAIADRAAKVGPDDARLLQVRNQMGGALKHAKLWDEAEAVYADVLARRTRVLGPDDPDTLVVRHNLALVWLGRGRTDPDKAARPAHYERALKDMQAVVTDKTRVLGAEDPLTIESASELPSLLRSLGRFEEARAAYATLLPLMRKLFGERHFRTLEAQGNCGLTCMQQEKWGDAVEVLRPTLDGYRVTRGRAYPDTVVISNWLAQSLEKLGRKDEAREVHLQTHNDLVETGAPPERLAAHAKVIAEFFERAGDAVKAAEWRAKAQP